VVVYGGGLELALCADFRVSFIENGPGKATFTGR
jgi:hypothetical protein